MTNAGPSSPLSDVFARAEESARQGAWDARETDVLGMALTLGWSYAGDVRDRVNVVDMLSRACRLGVGAEPGTDGRSLVGTMACGRHAASVALLARAEGMVGASHHEDLCHAALESWAAGTSVDARDVQVLARANVDESWIARTYLARGVADFARSRAEMAREQGLDALRGVWARRCEAASTAALDLGDEAVGREVVAAALDVGGCASRVARLYVDHVGSPLTASSARAGSCLADLALLSVEDDATVVMDVTRGGDERGSALVNVARAVSVARSVRVGSDPSLRLVDGMGVSVRDDASIAHELASAPGSLSEAASLAYRALSWADARGEVPVLLEAHANAMGDVVPEHVGEQMPPRTDVAVATEATPEPAEGVPAPVAQRGGRVVIDGIEPGRVTWSRDMRVAMVCFDAEEAGRARTLSGWFPRQLLSQSPRDDTWSLSLEAGRAQRLSWFERGTRHHVERTSEELAALNEAQVMGPRALDGHGRRPVAGQLRLDFDDDGPAFC